jgi:hypothetical protein
VFTTHRFAIHQATRAIVAARAQQVATKNQATGPCSGIDPKLHACFIELVCLIKIAMRTVGSSPMPDSRTARSVKTSGD